MLALSAIRLIDMTAPLVEVEPLAVKVLGITSPPFALPSDLLGTCLGRVPALQSRPFFGLGAAASFVPASPPLAPPK